jgi:hypothetical protein
MVFVERYYDVTNVYLTAETLVGLYKEIDRCVEIENLKDLIIGMNWDADDRTRETYGPVLSDNMWSVRCCSWEHVEDPYPSEEEE